MGEKKLKTLDSRLVWGAQHDTSCANKLHAERRETSAAPPCGRITGMHVGNIPTWVHILNRSIIFITCCVLLSIISMEKRENKSNLIKHWAEESLAVPARGLLHGEKLPPSNTLNL